MAKNTTIYLRISEAKNLPPRDAILGPGTGDPYCTVKVDNETVARTATVWKSTNPFWGEEYTLYLPRSFHSLSVYVCHHDTLGADALIGKMLLSRKALCLEPRGLEKWFPLRKVDKGSEVQGELQLEMWCHGNRGFTPAAGDFTTICCVVVQARDLAVKEKAGIVDAFVELSLQEDKAKTQVIKRTRFPKWKETFDFTIPTKAMETATLQFTVWDWEKQGNHDFLGEGEVALTELHGDEHVLGWHRLCPRASTVDDESSELGSLRLKVRCTEEHILPSQYYQPLVDLLVESVQSSIEPETPTPLSMLEEVMTMDRMDIATTLVKVFLGEGMVVQFLDALNTQEILNTKDPNTLFRGNSLATKSMDQFLKVVGMPYLHEVLRPVVDQIFEDKKTVELDPCKVDSCRRRLSVKSQSDGQLLEHSAMILTGYLEQIIDNIVMSVDQCPPVIRLAFRQLSKRVEDRFPEHQDVKYLAISGFLFLRFFAPAVLSPKLFALRDQHADAKTSRTCTLLAKVIQSIGNLGLQCGRGKETWMEPLHPFIQDSSSRVQDFLDQLIDIDEANVPTREAQRRSAFHQSVTIKEGHLLRRRRADDGLVLMPFSFKRRYYWLCNDALAYAKSSEDQIRTTTMTHRICAVERVDENAFQRTNVFQVIIRDGDGSLSTTYLQAKDVNEMHQWLSAIRKTCVTNSRMLGTFHPGTHRASKWTCCLETDKTARGCSKTHSAVTLGDWRDPLDPDAEAQTIYSQILLGRDILRSKYLELADAGSTAESSHEQANNSEAESNNSVGNSSESGHNSVPDPKQKPDIRRSRSFYDAKMAAAARLLDVIADLERVHEAFNKRERERAKGLERGRSLSLESTE
ncbi:rasGAP-activating-like protein 1 [Branchiostoma floridae]|uniref:RasGAP-activating-like protein 1 n=2 Tax=Branchiostoma floridae TaxID=7739 RepID=A0A9J7LXI2_BRAFL|nr:rasGAP-activating-like protein 1 [Branchiostoma floridae]